MKKIILSIGAIALIVNIICCMFIDKYTAINCAMASTSILFSVGFVFYLFVAKGIKDAFRISMSFIIGILGIPQFVLCAISPVSMANNWYLLTAISILCLEIALMIIFGQMSKSIKS